MVDSSLIVHRVSVLVLLSLDYVPPPAQGILYSQLYGLPAQWMSSEDAQLVGQAQLYVVGQRSSRSRHQRIEAATVVAA